ncbi:DUF4962 domain-containing protein [bacterium]|nr:DUF4962 domain-containing protein [bacterium]
MQGKSRNLVVLAICFLMIWALPAQAAVIRVKTDGNDNYDGSTWALAKATIQAAVTAASSGDQIWVAAGTYDNEEDIDLKSGIGLYGGFDENDTSFSDRDWETNETIIDGSGIYCDYYTSPDPILDGFKIQNFELWAYESSPTIANNTFSNPWQSQYWCVHIYFCFSSAIVSNNTFIGGYDTLYCEWSSIRAFDNLIVGAEWRGVFLEWDQGSVITNNTIVGCGNGIECYDIAETSFPATICNNIIALNEYGLYYNDPDTTPTISHNCVYGNTTANYYGITDPTGNDGNISSNPLFVDEENDDYHITSNSSCIDAGEDDEVETGWVDIDGELRLVDMVSGGDKVDIGADEYADTTAPSTPVVTDDGQMTACLSQIHASWVSTDSESGITEYQYAIGTTVGGTDIAGWTAPSPATATQVTHTGLSLVVGPTYYVSVKATNGQGLVSSVGTSDGIIAAAGLQNGNFEENFSNGLADHWNTFTVSGTPTFSSDNTNYVSANYSQCVGSICCAGVYQAINNLTTGQNYTASVWVKSSSGDVSTYVGINPYGCTDPASTSTVWSAASSSTDWTQISVTTNALTNAATVFIKVVNTASGESAYIDDAALVRDSITPWNPSNSGFDYRREVTLNSCDFSRDNVPLFVRISAPDGMYVNTTSVAVDEITLGTAVSVSCADIWAQPSGKVAEVHFIASGTTASGSQRRFLVYYNATNTATAYTWGNPNWGLYDERDRELPTGDDYFRLESDVLGLERSRWEMYSGFIGELKHGRRPGYSLIERLSDYWSPVEGFYNSYTATSGELVANSVNAEDLVVPTWQSDSSDNQVSLSFSFTNVTPSSPTGFPSHSAEETYRLIKGQPWCEFVMTVSDDVELTSTNWGPKILYFNTGECGFDYMVSDEYSSDPIALRYNTNVNWIVDYNSSDTSKAAGWYMFKPGDLRTRDNSGIEIFNSAPFNVEDDNTYRYLWVFGDRDDIVELFESMNPGWTVGDSATSVTIIQPKADTVFVPGDCIPIDICAPTSMNITAIWNRPSLSDLSINLVATDDGRYEASYDVQSVEDWGTWTLEVYDGQTLVASKEIEVLEGHAHPHVLFSSSDLSNIQARRTTTHEAMWNNLISSCNQIVNYCGNDPVEIPASGADIRSYGDRLLALALAVKVNPDLTTYKTKMWEYFWTMLRYKNWYDDGELWANNNSDLCGMIFLQSLAITYDWFYDDLTSTERQEVRRCLLQYSERALNDFWRQFDQYGAEFSLCNHIWIVHSGLASVAYALEDEMDETTRTEWDDKCEAAWDRIISVISEDGSHPEGVGYGCYGLEYLNRWVEMRRIAGEGNGFADDPWFSNTSRWLLYSVLPGGSDNCSGFAMFGDSTPYAWILPKGSMSLLARVLDDPIAQWLATTLVQPTTYTTPLRYLWYDATVSAVDLSTLPNWNYSHDSNLHSGVDYSGGIFTWRSSWDNTATYFSLKCGRTFISHAHPDAGTFILHRDGVPYIVDYGFTYKKMTDDENVLLLDYGGEAPVGQYGEGYEWFGVENEPQPGPAYWGSITHVLANGESGNPGAYFDVVCNPAPSYDSTASHLGAWTRECVGLGDFFMIRDVMSAESEYSPEFQLLLHSLVSVPDQYGTMWDNTSNPYDGYHTTYTYNQDVYRTTNPWATESGGWSTDPRKDVDTQTYTTATAAHELYVDELSYDTNWSGAIDASYYVPTSKPNGDSNVNDKTPYQYGGMLTRSRTANSASSLIGLRFDDQTTGWTLKRWNDTNDGGDSQAEGVVIRNSSSQSVLSVLWPVNGSCTSSRGWSVTGTMAGRRYLGGDSPSYFARETTSVVDNGTSLLSASASVSLQARMEHTPSANDPNTTKIYAGGSCSVTIYCPNQPTTATMDGNSLSFTWTSGHLTFTISSAGEHIISCY